MSAMSVVVPIFDANPHEKLLPSLAVLFENYEN
jgi:hypothetical protein